ncbi:HAD family hydrolase [Vibrio sp. B1Z05]|uniref:KdsC family phosphatase n=1 Tax=Vibrio sp. B1Z05 TaxID=2654980 RepID=UPI00128B2BC3|nr:HAD-IIIA family hydrolase [Vibrio sp. B1Z05]MPW36250.1 HAD-IIIA family hydrolase [Vibrio sp. B1Z05]
MSLKLTSPIRLVLFDVDGVMTDGSIYISELGEYFKSFNVQDGIAIELLRVHGIKTGVISGKKSLALTKRCEQLGVDIIETGCKNKLPKLGEVCDLFAIDAKEVAFCGDDVLDIPIMRKCGFSASPSDAHKLALESADWVSSKKGGHGFVRDFVDQLLTTQLQSTLLEIYKPLLKKIELDDVKEVEQ